MARRGKKKRTEADEAESSLEPGLEQPLEEEKTENNTHKIYRKKVKYISNLCETFCEQLEIIDTFKIFLEKHRKRIEEISGFKLEEYKASCGERGITKMLKAMDRKRTEKGSKNDETDKFLDEDTFHCLCDFEIWIGYLAGKGTPSEPPNVAAGSSGGRITQSSPLNEECKFSTLRKLLELVMGFCEKHGMIEEFKAAFKKFEEKVEEQGQFCEALRMVPENWEDGANQHSDEDIQKILKKNSSKNLESEMIQIEGIEGVTAMNSGSFGAEPSNVDSYAEGKWQSNSARGIGPISGSQSEGAELKRMREEELHEARRGKRPATADTPPRPSRPSGFMADARRQTSLESATAHLFSTNEGIETGGAVHDKVSSHPEVEKWKFTDEPGTGSNDFAKLLLRSFISYAIDLAQQYKKLQVKEAERRKQEQEVLAAASIDTNPQFKEMKKEIDDLKKQVASLAAKNKAAEAECEDLDLLMKEFPIADFGLL